MYRALAHQCETQGAQDLIERVDPMQAHPLLREKAAAHIERHSGAYEPFVVDADVAEPAAAQMAAFCAGVRGVEWGTQVELQALAAELRVYIEVRALRRGCFAVRGVGVSSAGSLRSRRGAQPAPRTKQMYLEPAGVQREVSAREARGGVCRAGEARAAGVLPAARIRRGRALQQRRTCQRRERGVRRAGSAVPSGWCAACLLGAWQRCI